MKLETQVQDLIFGVDQIPLEAVIGTNGHTRRVSIPSKKALFNQVSRRILDCIGRIIAARAKKAVSLALKQLKQASLACYLSSLT